eukprot:COSAG02_NODE_6612_length_3460_cov_1.770009_3_plen_169_part_00
MVRTSVLYTIVVLILVRTISIVVPSRKHSGLSVCVDAVRHMFRALAKDYGRDDVVCSGPMLVQTSTGQKTAESGTPTIMMTFEHVAGGLVASDGQPLRHFEIAGVDGIYHPASAVISGQNRATIEVASSSVADPVSVRYAWHEEAIGNLANSCGLPAGPFRTSTGARH